MEALYIIPARGGSKGIPGKNTRLLNGKPLLHYTIEYARHFTSDENICVSTDDSGIAACAGEAGLTIPFMRPAELSTDNAGMDEVLHHALNHFVSKGKIYQCIVLLQPTSPLRKVRHLQEAFNNYHSDLDMVVSVSKAKGNPYYNLFEEDENGFLKISKDKGDITARQNAPDVYQYNGAIYIINSESLVKKERLRSFTRVKKYIMDAAFSVDIDDETDWILSGILLNQQSKQL